MKIANGPCLGTREQPGKGPYKWLTYEEVLDKVKLTGCSLFHKIGDNRDENNNLKDLNNIGIYSSNRSEVSTLIFIFMVLWSVF